MSTPDARLTKTDDDPSILLGDYARFTGLFLDGEDGALSRERVCPQQGYLDKFEVEAAAGILGCSLGFLMSNEMQVSTSRCDMRPQRQQHTKERRGLSRSETAPFLP